MTECFSACEKEALCEEVGHEFNSQSSNDDQRTCYLLKPGCWKLLNWDKWWPIRIYSFKPINYEYSQVCGGDCLIS